MSLQPAVSKGAKAPCKNPSASIIIVVHVVSLLQVVVVVVALGEVVAAVMALDEGVAAEGVVVATRCATQPQQLCQHTGF